jgi:hypothetical protein
MGALLTLCTGTGKVFSREKGKEAVKRPECWMASDFLLSAGMCHGGLWRVVRVIITFSR